MQRLGHRRSVLDLEAVDAVDRYGVWSEEGHEHRAEHAASAGDGYAHQSSIVAIASDPMGRADFKW
jgi:hypothetical protein